MTKIVVVVFVLIVILSFSIEQERRSSAVHQSSNTDGGYGDDSRELAKLYCGMCHLFPEPSLLDRTTWLNSVLPNMGLRLGIRESGVDPYADIIPEEKEIIRKLNIYPEKPLLSKEQWLKIVDYYEKASPEQPLSPDRTDSLYKGTQFRAEMIFVGEQHYPKTSLLKFDTRSDLLYLGDAQNMLYILNNKFEFQSAWFTESPPVDIDFPAGESPRLLTIGVFNPSDQTRGRLLSFDTTARAETGINIDKLPRPVQFATGDLNMDGKEDVVVCGFGNNAGELIWYENFDPQKKHILKSFPGARKAIIRDMNRDGKPDIVVLMAQAWEEILIFYNLGGGKFREERVLQFPPVYGVSYFELADFNKDGHPDILLTNGDNWDYSPVEKSYHGVRIFLNNGKNRFKERYFFPMAGASKAIAGDFDLDGDVDIAAVSFYSKQRPENSFVYLENLENLQFKPYCFPESVSGKWLTMEAADFDKDGDLDIVVGSYIHTVIEMQQLIGEGVTKFPQLMVLYNKARD